MRPIMSSWPIPQPEFEQLNENVPAWLGVNVRVTNTLGGVPLGVKSAPDSPRAGIPENPCGSAREGSLSEIRSWYVVPTFALNVAPPPLKLHWNWLELSVTMTGPDPGVGVGEGAGPTVGVAV